MDETVAVFVVEAEGGRTDFDEEGRVADDGRVADGGRAIDEEEGAAVDMTGSIIPCPLPPPPPPFVALVGLLPGPTLLPPEFGLLLAEGGRAVMCGCDGDGESVSL